jgi:YD repeat-containing protein
LTVTIGKATFDHVLYNAGADVLYLHIGDPSSAITFEESPEGHALRYDKDGRLVGVTLVNARWLLKQGRPLSITIPERVEVDPKELASAISAA